MSALSRNEDKEIINNFKYNANTHSTMDEKKFLIPLYAEHIHFLVARASWLVTNVYQNFPLELSKFNKDLVVMNKKSRQKSTSPVERDFHKLLNNSYFGIDFRNNIDNCHFEPIYDEIGEIASIKQFDSIFDNEKHCDSSEINLMKEEVDEKYNQLVLALDKNNPTYEARKYSLESMREVDLDSTNSISALRLKTGKKRSFYKVENFF